MNEDQLKKKLNKAGFTLLTPEIDPKWFDFGDKAITNSQRLRAPFEQIWSKADFIHRAQVLARRLAFWHVDDGGPIWAPRGVDFLREVERPFRHRVLQGTHDPKEIFSAPTQLISTLPPDDSDGSIGGQAVTLHPDQFRKDETIWLFRDLYERLSQLGESEEEKLMKLKVEQLLDSRMYRRAKSEIFGDYIAGHQVDQSLLDELIEAAKLVALRTVDNSGQINLSVDSIVDTEAKIMGKKKTFEQIRDRFRAIESQDSSLIELRLIERCWLPSRCHSDLLHDFSQIDDSTGWQLVEQHDDTAISGKCHQVKLYALERDIAGSNQLTFKKWKRIAILAGNELDNYAPVTEDRTSIRGVSGWVWWMKRLAEGGTLELPLKSKYLDEELHLSSVMAADEKSADASKLREAVERNGMETRCTDAMTASILLADWLSYVDWPLGPSQFSPSDSDQQSDNEMRVEANIVVSPKPVKYDSNEPDLKNLPPPKYDPNSLDWILSETLCEVLKIRASTITEYRKPRKCGKDRIDEFGNWNIDCVGKFRRRVNSKGSVAYYRPDMTDSYKAKLSYAESQRTKIQ